MSRPTENIEVVFSFDTTGSMYPCLTQVRRTLKENVTRLFREIPNIRIGIIAHGDYCDAGSTYVTKHFDLSDDVRAICRFVDTVEATGGGDSEECYELVLHEARTDISWTSGKSKVLAMIGDDIPHGPTDRQNKKKINWRNELGLLLESGIHVYGVQALNHRHATSFYREIAEKTGGFHLNLDQFSQVTDMIMAICYRQVGEEQLQNFEQEIVRSHRMNRSMERVFNTLLNRSGGRTAFGAADFSAVPAGRFQVMDVDSDTTIKGFVEANGIPYVKGRGFYEFTKSENIQAHKEIVLLDKRTGDMYTGRRARELLGLPEHGTVRIRPTSLEQYTPFVQSTSYTRKLLGRTKFLYEVEGWDRE
jgi:hypothetical protein